GKRSGNSRAALAAVSRRAWRSYDRALPNRRIGTRISAKPGMGLRTRPRLQLVARRAGLPGESPPQRCRAATGARAAGNRQRARTGEIPGTCRRFVAGRYLVAKGLRTRGF